MRVRQKTGSRLLRQQRKGESVLYAPRRCRALGKVPSKNHFDQRGLFALGRDFIRRLGTPTRARGIQAGGSLAGNVSIRLRGSSSSTSVGSVSRADRALARPV